MKTLDSRVFTFFRIYNYYHSRVNSETPTRGMDVMLLHHSFDGNANVYCKSTLAKKLKLRKGMLWVFLLAAALSLSLNLCLCMCMSMSMCM